VIDGEWRDGAIRPNQIIAVSLEHSMLARDRAKEIVTVVERELFTPLGLRSLAPASPDYKARYQGGVLERDGAYHQGTVWAWLMGLFITAYVRANGGSKKSRDQAKAWLNDFHRHIISTAGLGQISEIFDAEAPHTARGCMAQAWSVAELLRAAAEDVYAIVPAGQKRKSVRQTSRAEKAQITI
jgi:glycogen debranching enzyme